MADETRKGDTREVALDLDEQNTDLETAMREAVARLGATQLFYLPDDADVVDVDAGQLERIAALPFVRWVGAYHPAYKMFPEDFAAIASGAWGGTAILNVVVALCSSLWRGLGPEPSAV